ncbi:DUF1631 family protein [Variovorax sp. PCZ-1]|uniref:DUF1631 family protein n=1 Tax=Variovorax sp. PCZ-1 TaxID=2835533 RepID=UPI001BCBF103|nr:DUF1631 family protein [Variovorax sp. PCZ-1]MBS7806940.1 DUF1631 family protein [Variovorax sp. PCZ-1]
MASSKPRPLGVIDEPFGARVTLRQTLDVVMDQAPNLIDKVIESLGGRDDKPAKGIGMVKPNFPPVVQAVVQLLISNKQKAIEVFVERLRYYVFLGVGTSTQAPQMMRFEDLKLFEEEDLDESIEVAGALQEITLLTDEIMPTMDALISSLLGWITVQPQINPLRPEMFARALRDCITSQVTDVEIRGAIIGHAAARLGVLQRKLYAELCQWLKSYGVEEAPSAQPANLPSVAKANPSSVSNSVARTLLTLDKLRRLLSGELDNDSHRRQDFLHTVPASVVALQDMRQVEAMVQRLEKKAKDTKDNPQEDARRKAAQARMALKDGRELGKQLGEEVVRLMLDNLIQDERLLPRVRAQLQTLENTLMKIAQDDGRFFSDKQHAARQFLDAVTNRSLGFSHEREEGYEPFLQSVEQSIALLHKKTDAGETIQLAFGDVMDRLSALWAKLDAQENVRREEAARALLHAEQRNTIAQYVAQEFRQQAEGVDMPQMVLDFVCGPWAHAVAESQLRCTDGRTDPQGYQGLVAELFWSVQPSKAKRNRKRLVQLIPGMLAKLRQGLAIIEFPPERITDFFAELIELHEVALEGGRQQAADAAKAAEQAKDAQGLQVEDATASQLDEAQAAADRAELEALYAASARAPLTPLDAEQTPQPVEPEPEPEPEPESDSLFDDFPSSYQNPKDAHDGVWLAQSEVSGAGFVNQQAVMPLDVSTAVPAADLIALTPEATVTIPIGSWVELMLDGAWVRAQLTWASPMRTLFMFVSRGGKAHSMSKRTMDKLCSQGLIRLVSDGRMVDKALDAVAQTALRNSVGETRSGS